MAYHIPSYTGTPYHTGTTLNWWGVSNPDPQTDPAGALRSYPDDPDWLNAFSISEGKGGPPHMTFRALSGARNNTTYINLSWAVLIDKSLTIGSLSGDGVDVLLANGSEGIIIKLRLPTISSTDSMPEKRISPAIQCKVYSDGHEGAPIAEDPKYLTETARCWIEYLPPSGSGSDSEKVKWAIQIAVPLESNLFEGIANTSSVSLPISTPFKFWYNVHTVLYQDPQGKEDTAMYPWPYPKVFYPTAGTIPTDQSFQPAELVVQPDSSVVCEQGITLDWNEIKVYDVTGQADRHNTMVVDLQKDSTGEYVNDPPRHDLPMYQNMFTASPTIPASMQANAGCLRGHFRLANWGSQSGTVTQDSWKIIPNLKPDPVLNPDGAVEYDVAAGRLELIWPKIQFDPGYPYEESYFLDLVKRIRNGTTHPHSCLLVELSSIDSSVWFAKSSAYVNETFVNASVFREFAEVSVVGLQPFSSQARDVYLYLEAKKMPVTIEDVPPDPDPITHVPTPPTYRIYAWHDTGLRRHLEDGRVQRIFEPQTSFGYSVSHKGRLYGWDTRLYGPKKISENFYLLQVPNNGSVRVEVAIQARESPSTQPLPPDGGGGCLYLLIAWLETKGPVGHIAALLVRAIARLVGQPI